MQLRPSLNKSHILISLRLSCILRVNDGVLSASVVSVVPPFLVSEPSLNLERQSSGQIFRYTSPALSARA